MVDSELLVKYNKPVPRYTSYPTVPNWKEGIDIKDWVGTLKAHIDSGNSNQGISIYIHLPFCESLCTYCGCNKKITTNHGVETAYINTILREWEMYRMLMNEKPVIREVHLGGGTPTFFSPGNIELLITGLLADADLHPEYEFSFEGHPNNTTKEHLVLLYQLGFRRVSFGVQDNDPQVQRVINRIQPIENVQYVTDVARSIGYQSINYDLIYGLPLQTLTSITKTIEQVISLRPDRIAFYSYAHVPWTSKAQRLFDEQDLPTAEEKIKLYQIGKELLLLSGYYDIGMDHFSLPTDDLYKVSKAGKLYRNFMGYTPNDTRLLIGLGVSSISATPNAFVQNAKTLHNYYHKINSQNLAIEKGYFLSEEDVRFGQYILDISCRGETWFREEDMKTVHANCMGELLTLEGDGLIALHKDHLLVTDKGKHFIRNICSALDLCLLKERAMEKKTVFSNAI